MMGRSTTLDDPYRPCEEEEFYDRNKYLVTIRALLYWSTYTHRDISFAASVFTRHNERPEVRHWNGIKHLPRYLKGIEDLGLYYTKGRTLKIIGYDDAYSKSHENSRKSQTGYIFLHNNAPIS